MDGTLACCAGGPGSIPAIDKSWFSPSRYQVVGKKWSQTRDLASPCSINNLLILLATPSMGEQSLSARNGKKSSISKEKASAVVGQTSCREIKGRSSIS